MLQVRGTQISAIFRQGAPAQESIAGRLRYFNRISYQTYSLKQESLPLMAFAGALALTETSGLLETQI